MTNEQLTKEVMYLKERQGIMQGEHDKFELILAEIQEEVKATKSLAEDVHIMAINMQSLQKAQEDANRKIDALTSKEFQEYKENKKLIKDKAFGAIVGGLVTFVGCAIGWVISNYVKGGM